MPYIVKKRRANYDPYLKGLISRIKMEANQDQNGPDIFDGDLNYCISVLVAGTMKPDNGWNYLWATRAYNAFNAAAAEFYRRILAPREDHAIAKNGDIEPYEAP